MSDQQSPVDDPPPFIVLNPDGSWTRFITYPCSLPTPDQDSDTLVLSKDVTINHINKTGVRIHLPKQTNGNLIRKLPLIFYSHGGGFVFMSSASTLIHDFCNQLASHLSAVVVSVDYRLAPEHRLPAAYDDAVEALYWIKSTQDPWLTNFADLSNCYLMGTSAGANIAYQVGLRVSEQLHDLQPLKVKGLILHHLFIGGVERTKSEIQFGDTANLTISKCEKLWNLSLPCDASLDHEFCNLTTGGGSGHMGRIKDVGWRVMITGCYEDCLIDRQMEFAKMLELKGVENECFYGEGYHAVELHDKLKAKKLFEEVLSFISTKN